MNFNSFDYILFFAAVLTSYWLVPKRTKIPLLLAASYFFYATLDWRFLGLIMLSTGVDYIVAQNLGRRIRDRDRRLLLFISIATNLAILGFFKYFNFFYEGVDSFLGVMGIDAPQIGLKVLLPVGISFYTFQSMSYTIDVYRREVEPTRNLVIFATYVAFFPQLLAGPIERARNLIPQLSDPRTSLKAVEVREGVDLIILGLFKKVAVGDVAARLVLDVYGNPDPFRNGVFTFDLGANWLSLLMAAYALVIQVYCDFSGYSDIARGSAKLLGIDISRNFRRPLWSTTYRELWQRWHITLFDWFRDYVYLPLGGSRRSRTRTYLNVLIVFTISGVWHGATSTFLLWGFLIGAVVCIEMAVVAAHRKRRPRDRPTPADQSDGPIETRGVTRTLRRPGTRTGPRQLALTWLGRIYVLNVFAITSVLIGSATVGQAFDIWSGIFTLREGAYQWGQVLVMVWAGAMIILSDKHQLTLDNSEDARRAAEIEGAPRPPAPNSPPAWATINGLFLVGLVVFAGQPIEPFFYFQF